MKKLTLALCAATLIAIVCPRHRAQAVPLDVPYGTAVLGVSTNTVTLSTATFPNATYQWCLEQVTVSPASTNATFSVYFSTNSPPLSTATTGYAVVITTNYFVNAWPPRQPFCAPTNNIVTLQTSVSGSTIAYQAFTFKGWN